MLCSQMIANQNLARTAPLSLRFPVFFDSPQTGNYNSPGFCGIRALFSATCRSLPSFQLSAIGGQLALSALESVFTQNAPATPLESVFTFYIGVASPQLPLEPEEGSEGTQRAGNESSAHRMRKHNTTMKVPRLGAISFSVF